GERSGAARAAVARHDQVPRESRREEQSQVSVVLSSCPRAVPAARLKPRAPFRLKPRAPFRLKPRASFRLKPRAPFRLKPRALRSEDAAHFFTLLHVRPSNHPTPSRRQKNT